MQKLKMFVLGVFFSLAVNVAVFAGVEEDDITVMPVHNTSKFFVSFADDIDPQMVTIRIKSKSGVLLFSEKMETGKVTKVYDMTEHGKGVYQVDIQGADFKISKKVELGKKAGFEAQVKRYDDHIELSYLSRDADLDIYIKDLEGNVLYHGAGTFGKYQRSFDVSHLPAGEYSLKVTNGDQIFEEFFEVGN